jgi:hypothetical protein
MSEPLSAGEIEDVLSSIRRLVSEDLRPAQRGSVDPSVSVIAQAAKPALILTPALRVVPEAAPPREATIAIGDVVASFGAAVEAQGQEWEPETGDPGAASDPVWAETAWNDPEPTDTALDDVAVAESDDPEPTIAAVGNVAGPALDGDVFLHADVAPVSGWAQSGSDDSGDAVTSDPPPSAMDAEWMALAEAEVLAGLEQDQHQSAGASFDPPENEREMSFDEEVLRDLVRDLIREELQGQLGERITRNIRKLVRAEIARALAVQDLT